MAETREQLARQTETLTSISGIVRTMKTLSAINATPYEQAASSIEAYEQTLQQGFAHFAYCTQGKYAQQNQASRKRLLIVFGSDHGLCGNYNEQIAQCVSKHCEAENYQVLCIGARMQRALKDHGFTPYLTLLPPASVDGVSRLANQLVQQINLFSSDDGLHTVQVELAYTERADQGARRPLQTTLLPLPTELFQPVSLWPNRSLPMFTMQEDDLLSALIRQYLFVRLYRASAEAMATENAARLALMKQAEEAVAERLEQVKQQASQVRQEEITTELMDIIIGHLDE